MIHTDTFGDTILYTLDSGELSLRVCELGATAVSLRYGGRELLLGYDNPDTYRDGTDYLGAAIGRVGNRIGGAAFTLDGVRYPLAPNEGPNQLHGGPNAFDKQRWVAEPLDENTLRLTLRSPDGENGYPGNLTATLTYRVEGNLLRLDFEGESDKGTLYAPTTHMYFAPSDGESVLNSELRICASRYVEPGPGLIPTGRLLPAEGEYDFRELRRVGQNYDHAFVLDSEDACTLRTGAVTMTLRTDFPALQVYTGEFLHPPFSPNGGIALEPEFFPDGPNHPDFPSIVLRAGERFHRWIEYRFSAKS